MQKTHMRAGTAGLLAVALWGAGVLVTGGGHLGLPGGLPEEPASDVLDFYTVNADRLSLGAWLFLLGSAAFVWFTVSLATAMRADEDTASGSGGVAVVAAGTTGALLLGMGSGGLVAALGAASLEASAAQALNAMEAVFFVAAQMSAMLMCASLALVAARTSALPRWWSRSTMVLAIWLAILPIGWVGLLVGVPVWTLVTGVRLLTESRDHRAEATVAAPGF